MQYIYVRTKSLLEKANYVPNINEVEFSKLTDDQSVKIIKLLYNFQDILKQVVQKNEAYILSRYLIRLSQSFSSFYNENKIIVDEKSVQNARLYLTYSVGLVLKIGANLLGITMPNRM